jgi:hypothetical protein
VREAVAVAAFGESCRDSGHDRKNLGVTARRFGTSHDDPFDLVLGEPLLGAVVELGRAWALMRGHRLRVLQRAAIGQIRRDPGRAE